MSFDVAMPVLDIKSHSKGIDSSNIDTPMEIAIPAVKRKILLISTFL